jgi:hypothetical protein
MTTGTGLIWVVQNDHAGIVIDRFSTLDEAQKAIHDHYPPYRGYTVRTRFVDNGKFVEPPPHTDPDARRAFHDKYCGAPCGGKQACSRCLNYF